MARVATLAEEMATEATRAAMGVDSAMAGVGAGKEKVVAVAWEAVAGLAERMVRSSEARAAAQASAAARAAASPRVCGSTRSSRRRRPP